jgi:hypothetical protein
MRGRLGVAVGLLVLAVAGGCAAESVGGMEIAFVGLSDGDVIAGSLDSSGQPLPIPVRIRVTGPVALGIGLSADELSVASIDNVAGETPFEVVVQWVPAWGAGAYLLEVGATTADKSGYASARIAVTVDGIPILARPAAPPSRDEAAARIIALYQERFGIVVAAPALARKERHGVFTDPWVSTAWIGSQFYQIDLFPDGHDESWSAPVGRVADAKTQALPICRPEGILTLLAVFIDYGNLGATAADVLAAFDAATRRLNEIYAGYPRGPVSAQPILQMETRGAVIRPPEGRDDLYLSPSTIRALTGLDPAGYQLVAIVDLDAADTARHAYVTRPDFDTFGLASGCCPCADPGVDVWAGIDDPSQLFGDDSRLLTTLLAHEVFHHFGYPGTHDWPCTQGARVDASDCCGSSEIPALFLGWIDTDGDGIPELLDPTPYGTAATP